MECYRFPALLSYLFMVLRQQSGPNRYFEKLMVNVVKAFFFTDFSLIPPVTNGEGPQEHAHALHIDVNQFVVTARVHMMFKGGVYFSS